MKKVIAVVIICSLLFAACTTTKNGCPSTRGMSGYNKH